MDWWKKTRVPAQHHLFAASYRYGFEHGAQGLKKKETKYFSYAEAHHAYMDGYAAGELSAKERAAGEPNEAE